MGGLGAQKDQYIAWAESGQKIVFVMIKERGQDFCSPVSFPALPICLPNSEGYEHSIVILASLENAHTVILVRGVDGHSDFLGRKMCPRIYRGTGVGNFFSLECQRQD